ncbi:MAG: M23 family peptidase, partial [Rubrivivax sp.]
MPLEKLSHHVQRASGWLSRHSRGLSAGFVLVLGGFAAAAFGVAPLLPETAQLTQRLVVDNIVPQGLRSQLDALAEHELDLWRSEPTRAGDTADSLFRRVGVVDAEAAA